MLVHNCFRVWLHISLMVKVVLVPTGDSKMVCMYKNTEIFALLKQKEDKS